MRPAPCRPRSATSLGNVRSTVASSDTRNAIEEISTPDCRRLVALGPDSKLLVLNLDSPATPPVELRGLKAEPRLIAFARIAADWPSSAPISRRMSGSFPVNHLSQSDRDGSQVGCRGRPDRHRIQPLRDARRVERRRPPSRQHFPKPRRHSLGSRFSRRPATGVSRHQFGCELARLSPGRPPPGRDHRRRELAGEHGSSSCAPWDLEKPAAIPLAVTPSWVPNRNDPARKTSSIETVSPDGQWLLCRHRDDAGAIDLWNLVSSPPKPAALTNAAGNSFFGHSFGTPSRWLVFLENEVGQNGSRCASCA